MKTHYRKDADTPQAVGSTIKLMTAILVMDWLDESDLESEVTALSSDVVNPQSDSNMGLRSGDVLSHIDLIYGLMLPSGNDAALALARIVGGIILVSEGGVPTDPTSNRNRFYSEMNTRAAQIGMTDTIFNDAAGIAPGGRSTAEDLAKLMLVYVENALLVTIAGTRQREITISGPNARTYTVTHTINPDGEVKLPEFICGKTGTVTSSIPEDNSGGCCVLYWGAPNGEKRVSVVLYADPPDQRFPDLRVMIDYELARIKRGLG